MSGNSSEESEKQNWEVLLKQVVSIIILVIVTILTILGVILAFSSLCKNDVHNAFFVVAAVISILLSTLTCEKWIVFDDRPFFKEALAFYVGMFFLLISGVFIFIKDINVAALITTTESCQIKILENYTIQLTFLICGILLLWLHQLNARKNKHSELYKSYQEVEKCRNDLASSIADQEVKISNLEREKEALSNSLNEKDQKRYIQKAAEMYQKPYYERVVTTMHKWLCAGENANVLQKAFVEAQADRIYFLGHIKPDINFVGVIWRLSNILNSKEPNKFRIYHLMEDDIYPLCIIGKRKDHRYINGDLVLSINDYSPEGDIRAYEVDVRQKMIAVLLNDYIDSILNENSDPKAYRNKDDTIKIKDGLLVVLEKLEEFKNRCINETYNLPNNEPKNISIKRDAYVTFIVDNVYSVKPADVSHIMKEGSFRELLNNFLDMLKDIGAIDFDGNSNVIFLSKITYEKSVCRLKKCEHDKDTLGKCLNENCAK